jgi:uncharacterized protein YydD (DUF2326 family)
VFKSATVTKTIDLLETENKALGQSVSRQAGDIAMLQNRVEGLEEENKVLKNMVTGRVEIENLTQFAKGESDLRRAEMAEIKLMLNSLMTLLKDLLGQLRGTGRGEIGRGEIGR